MGVFGTVVNVHVGDDFATQTVLGEHALKHAVEQRVNARVEVLVERLLHEHFGGQFLLTAGIAREGVVDTVGHLLASENHLIGIYDDHVVATLNVGRVAGLIFAHKDFGNLRAEATEMKASGIDYIPLVVNALCVRREGLVA